MFFDLTLFDAVILRHLWPVKWGSFYHSYLQPFIRSMLLGFAVRDLEQLDHPKIFNYVYLFAFFFGRKALIKNYNSLFNLGRYYFSFDVIVPFSNRNTITTGLIALVYELQPFLNLKLTTSYSFSAATVFTWNLWDLNIFTEKKTNVGLFDLLDSLSVKLFFNHVSCVAMTKYLIKTFKFQI